MGRKILLIAVAFIIVLVLAGAGALYWFLSGDGIRRALEQQASSWLGQPVRIGAARAKFLPRIGLELTDVQAGDPAAVTLQRVAISASLRPLLSRRIEDAEVTLADSRLELPLPFALPTSGDEQPADGPPGPADSEGNGVELVSVRAITLRDIVIASRGREVTVSADSSLNGTRLDVERFTASSGGTDLTASGTVELEPRIDATLDVTANRVNVDELIALAQAFSPPAGAAASTASRRPAAKRAGNDASAAGDARISARIKAASAKVGEVDVQNFATDLQSEGERVTLSPLSFELFGGKYDGSVTARLGDSLAATIESRLTDLDVAQLAAFGGAADTITGRLSGSGTFTGRGSDVDAALAGARGTGNASIADGTIQRLNLVRTVVLFFGRPAPGSRDGSDRFDRIDLRFSLANQVFRADAFEFRSPDVDIVGTGTLAIPTKALDGSLSLLLSEELSNQAGTDLARYTREGKRITLPAKLSGTLESPRVTIDAKAAITRGLRNEAEKRLKGVLDGLLK